MAKARLYGQKSGRRRTASVVTWILLIAAAGAGGARAAAAGPASAVLVLDASGSMWAQNGGKARIEVAREAIGQLLDGWDPAVELGLVAYGHRREGDCNDIEVLAAPAPLDRKRLGTLVAAIRPKGKTPLSAAVRKAAEAAKLAERRAAVILVSDGIETCNADPCELGAELERSGVDFTVHVVGFDVAERDESGLRCLARATGGSYFRAGDATALLGALREAGREIAAPTAKAGPAAASAGPAPPASLRAPGAIVAGTRLTVGWSGPGGKADVVGFAVPGAADVGGNALEVSGGNPLGFTAPSKPGKYELLYVQGDSRRALARAAIDVTPPQATLEAVETVTLGKQVEVAWTGPNGDRDFVTVVAPEAPENAYLAYAYTRDGSPARFAVPDKPGTYELRYVAAGSDQVLARRTIVAVAASTELQAAESAPAASILPVRWSGPNNKGDYVTVVPPAAKDSDYADYFYTESTAADAGAIRLPAEAGNYELRYVTGQSNQVLARRKIVVTPISATLDAAPSGKAAMRVEVRFTGPRHPMDYITVVAPDAPHSAYNDYVYVRDAQGAAISLLLPAAPGTYELRYVCHQGETVIARRKIEVN